MFYLVSARFRDAFGILCDAMAFCFFGYTVYFCAYIFVYVFKCQRVLGQFVISLFTIIFLKYLVSYSYWSLVRFYSKFYPVRHWCQIVLVFVRISNLIHLKGLYNMYCNSGWTFIVPPAIVIPEIRDRFFL